MVIALRFQPFRATIGHLVWSFVVESVLETLETIPALAGRPKTLRSAMTNGNRAFAQGGDGRSAWVRRWKDLVELHMADVGDPETLTATQISLCRRAATLEIELEQLEANLSEGTEVDLDRYGRLAGHLRRYLEVLAGQRQAKDVSNPVLDHFRPRAQRR